MVKGIRSALVLVGVAMAAWVPLRAQDPNPEPQQPVFRADINLIELDVSVLDRNRRPVRGLEIENFTVLEDGKPQRVVAVSHVDLADADQLQSARMRYVPRDVSANDLSDQLGDGRLIAIVFDDVNLPADNPDIVRSARETARYIVDHLGPSDMAAVVYAHNSGRTQDFTNDRAKLLDAINRFQPVPVGWVGGPVSNGGGSSDMLSQWSPLLSRSPCMRGEPAIPTLDTVAARLATAPGRRKAVMFISPGVALSLAASDSCGSQLADVMKDALRKAQRANVNIYPIDPSGVGVYQQYLRLRAAQRGDDPSLPGRRRVTRNIRVLQDFMRLLADQTGAVPVINTDAIDPAIDRILAEDRTYYIVGYESSNGTPDGRFRRVEVRVDQPGVSIRSRSGYWAPAAGEVVDRRLAGGPTATESTLTGLGVVQQLPLRALGAPVALAEGAAGGRGRGVDVATVLSVRYPPLRLPVDDTLTITRHIYDIEGRASDPVRVVETAHLAPAGGDESRHDVLQRLTLEPGRYQVRFQVHSELLDARGTVYADLVVPDLGQMRLGLSELVVARRGQPDATISGDLNGIVPLVPTTSREFTTSEVLAGFLRIYQDAAEVEPVIVTTELFDAGDALKYQSATELPAAAFASGAGVPFEFDIRLDALEPGPHLISVTARLPGGRTARRDLVFRVR